MASVALEGVSRVFPGGIAAVDRLDLQVRDGELLVLVGPSGCGKTTTLRLIAGLESLDSGSLLIAGRNVSRIAPRDRDVAMVFQGHALYPHLTVYQNLAFGLEMRRGSRLRRAWQRCAGRGGPSRGDAGGTPTPQAGGMPNSQAGGTPTPQAGGTPILQPVDGQHEIAARVRAAAQRLGIEPLLERMPGELSGGERQRVALGRALVRQPAVFLLDEPLSNLDALLRASLRSELKRLHRNLSATMVYVTHDQAEAMSLGDRIAILDRGRLQQIGEPLEVYRHPENRFVAGFLGSPPMNLFEATWADSGQQDVVLHGGGWALGVERGCLPGGLPAGPVVWGVRPEDLHWGLPPDGVGRLRLSAWVNLIEPQGDIAIVHLAPSGSDTASPADQNRVLLLKTDRFDQESVGQRVEVWFDAARLHWFDALTGRSVRGFEASKR
ncbi:MAG TPA: ABC transporter ATP-binding protein [Pirellulales bacterium]